LLQLGLDAGVVDDLASSARKRPPVVRYFGDYELLEEIGRGGMGVVYRARQLSLNRTVAVKMILAGHFASNQAVQRFRAEASAAAGLRHPKIVAIHEVGEHEGQQYFSMDYIEGRNLAEWSSEFRVSGFDFRRCAQIVRTVAEAIQFAHERGILHRDLKPSNVLLDADDEPHITDFGLAKRFVAQAFPPAGSSDVPVARSSAGQESPANPQTGMSALRQSELTLSGQVLGSPNYMPPEQASGRRGELGPAADVYGLGAILYHLVARRPPFGGATITETLRQVAESDPISPRLLTPGLPLDLETICLKCLEKEPARRFASAQELAEELGRFLRDEPIHSRPVGRTEKLWRWCRRKPALAGSLAAAAILLMVVAIGSPIAALRIHREREHVQQSLVRQYVANGTRLMNDGDLFGSLLWYAEALRLDAGNAQREEPHRIRIASVLRQCPKLMNVFTHGTMLYSAKFSPDGNRLVTASDDHTARVWDVNTGEVLLVLQHDDEVFDAVYSADGEHIVTSSKDKTARLWDAKSGAAVTPSLQHGDTVWCARFNPDGRLVATASADQTAQLWNATTGEKVGSSFRHEERVVRVAFSPDARLLSTVTWNDLGSVWDIATGKLLFRGTHDSFQYTEVAFSPDSRRFMTVDGHNLRVWEVSTSQQCSFSPLKHRRSIESAAFSPNGRYIVSTANDNTTAVWDAATGQAVFWPAIQREDENLQVAFSPDNRRVLTAGEDKIARVWNARTGRPVCAPLKHILMVKRCAFNSDGRRLLTYSCDQAGRVWDLATSEPLQVLAPALSDGSKISSPDSRPVLVRGPSNTLCIADATLTQVLRALPHEFRVTYASLSPDGHTVLTVCSEPNAVSSTRTTFFLWDAATGRRLNRTTMETGFALNCAAFSVDGTRLVTGGLDFTARVWDAHDGRPLTAPLRQGHQVMWVGFSPDGNSIITACWDHTARVWDVAKGRPLTALLHHEDRVCGATWSADGRRLETLTEDGYRQTWDLASSEPLTPPRLVARSRSSRGNEALANSEFQIPNSKFEVNLLASAATDELLPDNRPVEDLVLLARMLAVGRIDAGGSLVPLEVSELRGAWAMLRQKYPNQFAATPNEIAIWHQREAAECETDGDWTAVLFHLKRALAARPHDSVLWQQCSQLAAVLQQPAGVNLRQLELAHRIPTRDSRAQPEQIDLSAYYNVALEDSRIGKPDGEDLRSLRTGLQTFGTIPFDVRGVLHLSSLSLKAGGVDFPEHIEGIRVGRKCRRLHFLQATTDWVKHGVPVGSYVFHYANGEERELPIVYGRDTGRSWGSPRLSKVGEAIIVWSGNGNRPARLDGSSTLRVFKSTRDNLLPDVELVSIDFRSAMTECAPFLIAITVE
jgi:WD40 repeat protein/serine/threonine protein kinase